ncbi:MAG: efflux RND transporter periplasmic adaptor subunit [Vicinamibacteraceae bacterium]|nr:efflux RND transporter periplasmic adaptor subunit [Vicinamibacteraceae bacterium]
MARFAHARTVSLVLVVAVLVAAFAFFALRSGPLAPVPVTLVTAESKSIAPALFGIGTVEARFTYTVGPTAPGRVARVAVDVGDRVTAGQLLAEMDRVDVDERLASQSAALDRGRASLTAAEAQLRDARSRKAFADAQAARFDALFAERVVSGVEVEARHQERDAAAAAVDASAANLEALRNDLRRIGADRRAIGEQRRTLRLVAPVDGLVARREAEPGTTLVAGQAIIELIDPASLWIAARFDQSRAAGLRTGLAASIVLRSRPDQRLSGQVVRIEPRADAITEELRAKVAFDAPAVPMPSVGEIAEVTATLPPRTNAVVVPNGALHVYEGRTGVWVLSGGALAFTPVRVGASTLDGEVEVLAGLEAGAQVVLYSQRALTASTRVTIVDDVPTGRR